MNSFIPILTAPFASLGHFAPYHYCSGFSRYWYEYHLTQRGFQIKELPPNGDGNSYGAEQHLNDLPAVLQLGRFDESYISRVIDANKSHIKLHKARN